MPKFVKMQQSHASYVRDVYKKYYAYMLHDASYWLQAQYLNFTGKYGCFQK